MFCVLFVCCWVLCCFFKHRGAEARCLDLFFVGWFLLVLWVGVKCKFLSVGVI